MSWMARLEKRFSTLRRQWLIHIGWIRVDWLTMSLIQFLGILLWTVLLMETL